MITVSAYNVPEAFVEVLLRARHYWQKEETRNGPVYSIPEPITLTISKPVQRVLTDPDRDANPFFHVMEFCWMMAGSNDIQWIAQFNKRMMEYSDNGLTQHAAYGYRWRKEYYLDQIKQAIVLLRKNKNDRRVVIGMWEPASDLARHGKDVPCNTHIYLRVVDGRLDMTVCNRSNDLVWGMLGANAVHMTMLQELIAQSVGIPVGYYRVMSNNAHLYESVPNFRYYAKDYLVKYDVYDRHKVEHFPLLQGNETYTDFVVDCENLLRLGWEKPTGGIRTRWMRHVGSSMIYIWMARKLGFDYDLNEIKAEDWRIACAEWIDRRATAALDNQYTDDNTRVDDREQEHPGLDDCACQPNPVADVDNSGSEVGVPPTESGTNGDVLP